MGKGSIREGRWRGLRTKLYGKLVREEDNLGINRVEKGENLKRRKKSMIIVTTNCLLKIPGGKGDGLLVTLVEGVGDGDGDGMTTAEDTGEGDKPLPPLTLTLLITRWLGRVESSSVSTIPGPSINSTGTGVVLVLPLPVASAGVILS